MAVRSSLYNRITVAHEHEFGEETHVEEDTYSRKCTSCGYEEKYEKM
jgi:DNA-repair protein complementing XP-A cells